MIKRKHSPTISARWAEIDPETKRFLEWITMGLQKPGKNMSGLARALGRAPPQGRKLLDGKRKLLASELAVISRYLEEPIPLGADMLAPLAKIMFSAGEQFWYERSLFNGTFPYKDSQRVPAVPDPRYTGMTQYAARMDDDSMSRAIEMGAYAIFVDYHKVRPSPVDGDLIAVEIRRDQLYKASVLRMAHTPTGWELQTFDAANKNGKHPCVVRLKADLVHSKDGNEEITMRGLVIAKFAMLAD